MLSTCGGESRRIFSSKGGSLRDAADAIRALTTGGETIRVRVCGRSMAPTLREPMTVAVESAARYRTGDIVVYRSGGRLVAHRLLARAGDALLTCGDARPWAVERVPIDDVVGRVCAVYDGAGPTARRIDDVAFAARGMVIAALRSPRESLRRISRALKRVRRGVVARRRPQGFASLLSALAAVEAGDTEAFSAALRAAPHGALLATASRHRCLGPLQQGMNWSSADATVARRLRPLQTFARETSLHSIALRLQLREIVAALDRGGVVFALLKGAARIHAADPAVDRHPSSDIDILVPADHESRACAVLRAAGYEQRVSHHAREGYRRHHHHCPAFHRLSGGACVEVHRALAPPGVFAQPLDWAALQPHIVDVQGTTGCVRCLDEFGAGLNLAVHAIDLRRLRDVVLLAQLIKRSAQPLVGYLQRFACGEDRQRIRLLGVVALACRLAGRRAEPDAAVARYVDWIIRREHMPACLRRRSHLVDAWHANGGRLFGPALSLLFVRSRVGVESGLLGRLLHPCRVAGRVVAGMCAALYAAAMPLPRGS